MPSPPVLTGPVDPPPGRTAILVATVCKRGKERKMMGQRDIDQMYSFLVPNLRCSLGIRITSRMEEIIPLEAVANPISSG